MSGKDAGLRIRVERELREAFQGACLAENRHASDVLRDFMQTYVERHQKGQGDLFPVERGQPAERGQGNSRNRSASSRNLTTKHHQQSSGLTSRES